MDDDRWEDHSDWWQQEFTDGADSEYEEQILPLAQELLSGEGRILDVGTGEGQVARLLAAQGSLVVGIDPTHNQIVEAVARGGGPRYLRGGAAELPFASASFDAAVACLVFEHIDEMDSAIAELARVVRPGGRFVFMLNHPLLQTPGSGWIDDHVRDPPEQYWRIGPYLTETTSVEEVQKDVFIPFVHRPLGRYVNALIEAGFNLERMIEPVPPPELLARAAAYEDAATIPRLLVLVSRRSSS